MELHPHDALRTAAPSVPPPRRRAWVAAGVGAALLAVAAALALSCGALDSGFGAHDDEPAHLVTGLMVHDYLCRLLASGGAAGHPMAFAADYYLHYPKVALGHWPPVFPLLQSVWYLAFGTSPLAIVLLMSCVAGLLALALFAALRGDVGPGWAAAAALLLLLLPDVQRVGHSVMTELPVALFGLLAAVHFGRFLDGGRAASMWRFALWSVLAILTKGSGLFLALVPPLAIAWTRRFELLRRPVLWAAGAAVAAVCGPWFWLTLGISRTTWSGGAGPSVAYAAQAAAFYGPQLVAAGGVSVALLAAAGLLRGARARRCRGLWAALLAWLFAQLVGLLAVPTGPDARHLVGALVVWLALWAAGAAWLTANLQPRWLRGAAVAAVLALAAGSIGRPAKDYRGFDAAARDLVANPSLQGTAVLIASDPKGEGMSVAEVALREQRPGHFVLRASKVLCDSDWIGSRYAQRFGDVAALAAFLAEVPVAALWIDGSVAPRHRYPHDEQLEQLLRQRPDQWVEAGAYDIWRAGVHYPRALKVFHQRGAARPPRGLDPALVLGERLPPGMLRSRGAGGAGDAGSAGDAGDDGDAGSAGSAAVGAGAGGAGGGGAGGAGGAGAVGGAGGSGGTGGEPPPNR